MFTGMTMGPVGTVAFVAGDEVTFFLAAWLGIGLFAGRVAAALVTEGAALVTAGAALVTAGAALVTAGAGGAGVAALLGTGAGVCVEAWTVGVVAEVRIRVSGPAQADAALVGAAANTLGMTNIRPRARAATVGIAAARVPAASLSRRPGRGESGPSGFTVRTVAAPVRADGRYEECLMRVK